MSDVLALVHRRYDDADLGLTAAAAIGARVWDGTTGGQRFHLDQRDAADAARRRRRRLEQVERAGEQADRDADRLEGAHQVEEALVVGMLGGDDYAIGVVSLDDFQGGDPRARLGLAPIGGN